MLCCKKRTVHPNVWLMLHNFRCLIILVYNLKIKLKTKLENKNISLTYRTQKSIYALKFKKIIVVFNNKLLGIIINRINLIDASDHLDVC